MTSLLDTATSAVNTASVKAPEATADARAAKQAAEEFESVFVAQMLNQMFEGVSTDGPFGGGQGEAMFRSLMMDEYAKQISAQGGIGLADTVTRQLLSMQESRQ